MNRGFLRVEPWFGIRYMVDATLALAQCNFPTQKISKRFELTKEFKPLRHGISE
jgi:hypothetical protein